MSSSAGGQSASSRAKGRGNLSVQAPESASVVTSMLSPRVVGAVPSPLTSPGGGSGGAKQWGPGGLATATSGRGPSARQKATAAGPASEKMSSAGIHFSGAGASSPRDARGAANSAGTSGGVLSGRKSLAASKTYQDLLLYVHLPKANVSHCLKLRVGREKTTTVTSRVLRFGRVMSPVAYLLGARVRVRYTGVSCRPLLS